MEFWKTFRPGFGIDPADSRPSQPVLQPSSETPKGPTSFAGSGDAGSEHRPVMSRPFGIDPADSRPSQPVLQPSSETPKGPTSSAGSGDAGSEHRPVMSSSCTSLLNGSTPMVGPSPSLSTPMSRDVSLLTSSSVNEKSFGFLGTPMSTVSVNEAILKMNHLDAYNGSRPSFGSGALTSTPFSFVKKQTALPTSNESGNPKNVIEKQSTPPASGGSGNLKNGFDNHVAVSEKLQHTEPAKSDKEIKVCRYSPSRFLSKGMSRTSPAQSLFATRSTFYTPYLEEGESVALSLI
ncbi:hypothetical protein COOONC_00767 [Cooperia oncophora]